MSDVDGSHKRADVNASLQRPVWHEARGMGHMRYEASGIRDMGYAVWGTRKVVRVECHLLAGDFGLRTTLIK